METTRKSLIAAAVALPLLQTVPMSAQAVPFTFSDISLGGADTFVTDELVVSWVGTPASLAITDANFTGMLDAGDTFTETGVVYNFGFKLGGAVLLPSVTGLFTSYEMFGDFSTLPAPSLSGVVAGVGPGGVVGSFAPASTINIYYDTVVDGVLTGGSTLIGVLGPANAPSQCIITSPAFAEGSCKLDFTFDAGGATAPGVWTIGGIDLANLGAHMDIDINVDEVNPPLSLAYAGGPGSTQVSAVKHDGSVVVSVPEPTSIALLGLGLGALGLGLRRGKQLA